MALASFTPFLLGLGTNDLVVGLMPVDRSRSNDIDEGRLSSFLCFFWVHWELPKEIERSANETIAPKITRVGSLRAETVQCVCMSLFGLTQNGCLTGLTATAGVATRPSSIDIDRDRHVRCKLAVRIFYTLHLVPC